ncbi:MAG: ComF family protein [Pseudomonadota bacterium]
MSIFGGTLQNIRLNFKRILPAQPCTLCGKMNVEGLWCANCDQSLPYLRVTHCPVCALPTPLGAICGHCLTHPPLFTRTTAVFTYTFPLDKLIQAMKYGEQLALAKPFARLLAQSVADTALPDCIIPMPLHPSKLRERGFNQSALLAADTARQLQRPLLMHACQRVRDTPPQSALPWKERKRNVRNAFHCSTDLTGKHVALVDDVLTTGASLNALAAAVKKTGASQISAWVIARTLPHGHLRKP